MVEYASRKIKCDPATLDEELAVVAERAAEKLDAIEVLRWRQYLAAPAALALVALACWSGTRLWHLPQILELAGALFLAAAVGYCEHSLRYLVQSTLFVNRIAPLAGIFLRKVVEAAAERGLEPSLSIARGLCELEELPRRGPAYEETAPSMPASENPGIGEEDGDSGCFELEMPPAPSR